MEPIPASGRPAGRHRELLWRRRVALAVGLIATVVALRSDPGPGAHGVRLVVLLSLIGMLLGCGLLLAGIRSNWALSRWATVLLFAAVMAGSFGLAWVEPAGAGFIGGYVIAGVAASRMRPWTGATLSTVLLVALAVAATVGANRPLLSTVVSELGAVAFFRLGVYTRRLAERTTESEQLLAELEQTREAQLRSATLAERQRLAREMHDVLAHSLSGLLLHLEGARLLALHDGVNPKLTDTIERAHHLAQSGLGEARQAIGMLRDDDLPGLDRLPILTEQFERDTGIPCSFTVSGGRDTEFDAQTRLTLYRVAQEALTNIRKHAHPQRVEIRLAYRPTGIELIVEDVGAAAPPPRRDHHGYGVTGMRERAELLGGTLTAAPTGSGFVVTLRLPA